MIRAACLVAVIILTTAHVVRAEHEVYYRYVVLGYVKNPAGQPVRGANVEVVRDKTAFAYRGDTDAEGFYVLVVRLGDESVGESLSLKIRGTSTRLTARFDATNHTEARGTRVDLEGVSFIERAASFPSTLARFLETPAR